MAVGMLVGQQQQSQWPECVFLGRCVLADVDYRPMIINSVVTSNYLGSCFLLLPDLQHCIVLRKQVLVANILTNFIIIGMHYIMALINHKKKNAPFTHLTSMNPLIRGYMCGIMPLSHYSAITTNISLTGPILPLFYYHLCFL